MGCELCEIRAQIDGRSVHVWLKTENIMKISDDTERIATLYQCPQCKTYWELGCCDKEARQVTLGYVQKHYHL